MAAKEDAISTQLDSVAIHCSTKSGRDTGPNLCCICQEPCVNPVKLPCSHIFCFLCIKGAAARSNHCALCRQRIAPDVLSHPSVVNKGEIQSTIRQSGEDHRWYYEARNGGWWLYEQRTSTEIEKAFKDNKQSVRLQISGFYYIINLESMFQYREEFPNRRRLIKRDKIHVDAVKGVAGIVVTEEKDVCGDTKESMHKDTREQERGGRRDTREQERGGRRDTKEQERGGHGDNREQERGGHRGGHREQERGGRGDTREQERGGRGDTREQERGGRGDTREQERGGHGDTREQERGGRGDTREQERGGHGDTRQERGGRGDTREQERGGRGDTREQERGGCGDTREQERGGRGDTREQERGGRGDTREQERSGRGDARGGCDDTGEQAKNPELSR